MRARIACALTLLAFASACTDHMQLLGPGLEGGLSPASADADVPWSSTDGAISVADASSSVDLEEAKCPGLSIVLPALAPNPLGDGTPGSCTALALAERLVRGGLITFRCGAAPLEIVLSSNLVVSTSAVIDGGEPSAAADHRITLQAAPRARLFTVRNGTNTRQTVLGLKNLTLKGGQATSGATAEERAGGAILNEGAVVIVESSTLRENRSGMGGAIAARGDAAVVVLADSALQSNASTGHGGALALDGGQLSITRSKISGNSAAQNGGGTYIAARSANLSMCGATFQSNMAGQIGGGLYLSTSVSGEAKIVQSAFASNVAGDATTGGGQGGAMYTQGAAVTLSASTISGNQAGWVAGAWVGAFRDFAVAGTLTMENVTIADNQNYPSADMGYGSGLWLAAPVQGTIKNCTIADNEGSFATGIATGGSVPAEVVVSNSIIANDPGRPPLNCTQELASGGGGPNLQWPADTASASAAMPVRCGGASTIVGNPELGALRANKGPTETMAIGANSPAAALGVACPAFDQRGVARRAVGCALGAYEPN